MHLRADVRLVERGGLEGLHCDDTVIWLPRPLAQRLLDGGSTAAPIRIHEMLSSHGFLSDEAVDGASERSRSEAFLAAVMDGRLTRANSVVRQSSVMVVGAGGLGSAITEQLSSLGLRRWSLVDGDVIEASNRNRLVWTSAGDIGARKVDVLAAHLRTRWLAEVDTLHRFVREPQDVEAAISAMKPSFGVLAVDNGPSARAAAKAFVSAKVPFIHVGYVGAICSVGPIWTEAGQACPFCSSEEIRVTSGNAVSPSALPNNQLAAGAAAVQLLRHLAGRDTPLINARWVLPLDTLVASINSITPDPYCKVCQ